MIQNDLGLAIHTAVDAHYGQKDRGGNPYILHPLFVMNHVKMYGNIAMIVAILHDVVEDTPVTIEGLRKMGFTDEVLIPLTLLTHLEGVPYEVYIEHISFNRIASLVKMGDLVHNSDLLRLKGVREKDLARAAKYHKAFMLLHLKGYTFS